MPCKRLFVIRPAALLRNSNLVEPSTGSYSLLTNGSPGVLSRQVEKRVHLPSPTKGIIILSLISVLVCELCWFFRVKARNNERERRAWRPNDPRHGYSFCTTVRQRNSKRTISIRALTRHIRLNHKRYIRIFLRNLHLLQLMMHMNIELQPMSLAQQQPSSTVASSPS